MRRYRLGLARPLQHKQLRQHRHAFQPDGKRPEDFGGFVLVWEEEGEEGGEGEEVGHFECIDVGVVRGAVVV